ncbi:STAS-like domain-containing protein [Massilia sp. TS11]|uniref:STAS-like domain-containing protein n=1 Tax=Massilia sp. TS11 TaxID=2908003 RepID=UPI001EDC045D|nr:STAS-like domain-containing protein [Massilia sp. TS11]MCG2585527.1 STAS-like domain-containing protein [Massilia sp. TS11]
MFIANFHFLRGSTMMTSFSVDIMSLATELTTRPVGAQARQQLLDLLHEHDHIEIDFHDQSLTPSFADECIGRLAAQIGLIDFKNRVKLVNVAANARPLVRHVILTRCGAA